MKLCIAAVTVLLLAGCGGQAAKEQAGANRQAGAPTGSEPAPAGGAGGSGSLTIEPGLWEISMEMQAAQVSGMPAGMHLPNIPPTTMRSCVTPEQVARANASFLSGSGHAGMNCDYSGVTVAGGRIQGTSTCSRAGMSATVTMDGSFTPTSYDVHQQMQSTMRGRTSSSTSHLVGRRIGACAPGETGAGSAAGSGRDGR